MHENDENRIQELLVELQECREDERSEKNQIVQVILAGITLLGFLLGTSFWGEEKIKQVVFFIMDGQEVVFYLSFLVFAVVFCYVIVLGTTSVLRYYYIRDIEDRLFQLIPCDSVDLSQISLESKRNKFIHWGSYSGPIVTRNVNHITSSHTLLVFTAYTFATLLAILFCAGIVIALFVSIKEKSLYAQLVFIIGMVGTVIAGAIFMRTSMNNRMAVFAKETALKNRENRMNNKAVYDKSKHFRRKFFYMFYPKYTDLQKSALIGIIFFLFWMYFYQTAPTAEAIIQLLVIWFVIDFLAYQARYQINDLRGLSEDRTAGKRHRIFVPGGKQDTHLVIFSIKLVMVRVFLAVFIAFGINMINKEWGVILLIELGALLFFTLMYEYVRKKEYSAGVYFWVGSGYAFRLVVGILAVNPHVWEDSVFGNTGILEIFLKVLLIVGFWSYGTSASTLSWATSVCNRMNQNQGGLEKTGKTKKHDQEICFLLKARYNKATNHRINNKIMPLRERGKLCDVWNASHLCAVASLEFIVIVKLLEKQQYNLIVLEFVTFFLAILYVCCMKYKGLAVFVGIETILIVLKIVFAWIINPGMGNILIY